MTCFYLAKSILFLCVVLMLFQLFLASDHPFEIATLGPLAILLIRLDLVLKLRLKPQHYKSDDTVPTQLPKAEKLHPTFKTQQYAYQSGSKYLMTFGIGLLVLSFVMQS